MQLETTGGSDFSVEEAAANLPSGALIVVA